MMTNADKIRSMTDEELVACLTKIAKDGIECFWARSCNLCYATNSGQCPARESDTCLFTDDGVILAWLKAETEN